MSEAVLRQGLGAGDLEALRTLFLEYAEFLDFSLCFQGFDRELATLPGSYAPPQGCWLLATIGQAIAGCVAVRPLTDEVCEMKRLYVRPAYRDLGLGRRLAVAAVDAGRQCGYRAMRLDTLSRMGAAVALYRSMGFVHIPPFGDSPLSDTLYFEKSFEMADSADAALVGPR